MNSVGNSDRGRAFRKAVKVLIANLKSLLLERTNLTSSDYRGFQLYYLYPEGVDNRYPITPIRHRAPVVWRKAIAVRGEGASCGMTVFTETPRRDEAIEGFVCVGDRKTQHALATQPQTRAEVIVNKSKIVITNTSQSLRSFGGRINSQSGRPHCRGEGAKACYSKHLGVVNPLDPVKFLAAHHHIHPHVRTDLSPVLWQFYFLSDSPLLERVTALALP